MELAFATTRDEGSIYWNRFSWAMKFRRFSPQLGIAQRLIWRVGLLFGTLWKPLEDREGKGACYTAILRNSSEAPSMTGLGLQAGHSGNYECPEKFSAQGLSGRIIRASPASGHRSDLRRS